MRVMLLGAGGVLGHDLVATTPPGVELHPLVRGQLDITDVHAVQNRIAKLRPSVVINAAAYTAVDKAESEPDVAFRTNAEAVGELGRIASAAGAFVVHFSTDYVFDGDAAQPYAEASSPNPVNVYGATKLAGERALAASGVRHLVVRTSWLFGIHGHSFPRTMFDRARRNEATRVVTDQVGRPTYALDLARATWDLVVMQTEGILHVANSGVATWYEVAQQVFQSLSRAGLLSACTTADYPRPAKRPKYSVLDLSRHAQLTGASLPPWKDAMTRFLSEPASPVGVAG